MVGDVELVECVLYGIACSSCPEDECLWFVVADELAECVLYSYGVGVVSDELWCVVVPEDLYGVDGSDLLCLWCECV